MDLSKEAAKRGKAFENLNLLYCIRVLKVYFANFCAVCFLLTTVSSYPESFFLSQSKYIESLPKSTLKVEDHKFKSFHSFGVLNNELW